MAIKKKIFLIFLLTLTHFLYSLEPGNYLPTCSENHEHIRGERIAYCYNINTHINNWSYYTLTKEQVEHQGFKRPTAYYSDPSFRDIVTSDYTNSGYDRGHLAPSEDFDESENALREANYMSNISPQDHKFNAGIWKKVENRARQLAKEHNFVIIITGPLYRGEIKTISLKMISVPTHFYKIVIWETGMEVYNIPNEPYDGNIETFLVSLTSIETAARIKVER
jgi:endonuclease G